MIQNRYRKLAALPLAIQQCPQGPSSPLLLPKKALEKVGVSHKGLSKKKKGRIIKGVRHLYFAFVFYGINFTDR